MTGGAADATPVIIIAAARSGTKFLRDTLAAAPGIAAVPFDINYVWRRGNEALDHDELDPDTCSLRHADSIRRDVSRLALRGRRDSTGVVLEKTVSNCLRVPFVERVMSGARYISLIRDGRAVVESSLRSWREPVDYRYLVRKARTFPLTDWRYGLRFIGGLLGGFPSQPQRTWGPVYRGMQTDLESEPLDVVVARQWRRCIEVAREGLAAIPDERVFTIRYEDLASGPEWIPDLARFIGVEADTAAVVQRYQATLDTGARDRWRETLSEAQREKIWTEIEPAMNILGYRGGQGHVDSARKVER